MLALTYFDFDWFVSSYITNKITANLASYIFLHRYRFFSLSFDHAYFDRETRIMYDLSVHLIPMYSNKTKYTFPCVHARM